MITKNLYDLGLFNGDIGICLWGSSGLSVYFEGETLRMVAVDMLSDTVVSTAYAITVHKSQGSEWQKSPLSLMAIANACCQRSLFIPLLLEQSQRYISTARMTHSSMPSIRRQFDKLGWIK